MSQNNHKMDLFQPRKTNHTFLETYPDEHKVFDIQFDGKTCRAIGSERKYKWMTYLATTPFEAQDPFEHAKLRKMYTDKSKTEDGIYFAFGQRQVGPGKYKKGEDGGHHSTFISILRLRFGQERASHSYYDVNFDKLKL